ncbi:anti-sigma regulatory factor [Prolixibacteraceae bacterium JC049]|nr:anti-sigma regulatory factor [Prolixibacteraceae bacterium JC049]
MQVKYQVEGGDFTSAGYASSQVKKLLKQLNVAPKVIKNVVVALYEAEVNIVAHAYRGVIEVELDPQKITLVLEDEGPGIPNIDLAMQEGFSTASPAVREMGFGAGMGLPNIKRNVDDMQLESQVDKGTRLTLIKFFNA